MSTPHKASAEQWSDAGAFASDTRAWLLALRTRVEALEREAAMNELRAASSLVKRRPLRCPTSATIAECGGPCEQGFHLCDCGLLEQLNPELRGPAPASSLVERVDRAAIREVAAWLRDRGGYPWAWVAQTLEQEADR